MSLGTEEGAGGGEMNCLSQRTALSGALRGAWAGSGNITVGVFFFFWADEGARLCQKLIRLNRSQIKSISDRCECVITADYLRSKGSNIIEEDIKPQWDMNI